MQDSVREALRLACQANPCSCTACDCRSSCMTQQCWCTNNGIACRVVQEKKENDEEEEEDIPPEDEKEYNQWRREKIQNHPPTSECPVPECVYCSSRDCPSGNELHYFHVGCPDCSRIQDS